ncbi:MAG: ABC transporter substrate-binding protein [Chloroflexota bacterium]|nr:ABC transporter substrate-binding protein [Chloroflexota bacterium]
MTRTSFPRLALAATMALALAACGPGGQTTPGATEPGGTPAETGTPAVTGSPAATGSPAVTGSPGVTGSPTTTGSPTAAECPDTARDQRVEMWSPLTGPDGDEMTRLAQQYSEENQNGITVEHVPQPDYVTVLNTAAAGAQLPAMTVVRVVNVAELVERGVLQPFPADLVSTFGFEGQFPDNVWGPGEYEGQRYSIPLDMHPLVMYYNRDLFQQAGVAEPGDQPWTVEEFEQALQALEGAGGARALSIGTHFQGGALFQTLIRQFGGALVSEDGTDVTYDEEPGVQALQRLNELQDQYSEDITGTGDPEVQEFQQGRAAIVMHGPWWITGLQELEFTGFAPVPQMGGTEYAVWGGSHQLALTSTDPAVQAAAGCWIAWLTENSVQWGAAGQVPARNSAREDPQLETIAPAIGAIAESGPNVIILPQVAGIEHALWGEGFGPVVDAVLTGQETDIQGALQRAAEHSQQLIDENAGR